MTEPETRRDPLRELLDDISSQLPDPALVACIVPVVRALYGGPDDQIGASTIAMTVQEEWLPTLRAAVASTTPDALDVEALAMAKFYDDNPNDHYMWNTFGEASRAAMRKWAHRIAAEYAAILELRFRRGSGDDQSDPVREVSRRTTLAGARSGDSVPTQAVITRDAAHRYTYEGVVYPGVTDILTVVKAPGFRSEAYKAAGVLGTQVHALAEYVARGELVPFDGGSDKAMLYARNYAQWWQSSGWKLRLCEAMVVNPDVGYGGTFDLLAYDAEGRTVLADIKTGSKLDKAAILQLTAYGMASHVQPAGSEQTYTLPVPDRYVIIHVQPDIAREVEIEVTQADRMAFLDTVDLHRWVASKKGLRL